jgi:hypothetical protein
VRDISIQRTVTLDSTAKTVHKNLRGSHYEPSLE